MKKLNYLTFIFAILILTISFNAPSYSIELKKPADLLKKKKEVVEKNLTSKMLIQILLKHFLSHQIIICKHRNIY